MSWGKIVINNCISASDLVNQVQEIFELSWRSRGCPDEAALFSEFDPVSGNRIIYLSPKALEISEKSLHDFNPAVCHKPKELKSWLSASPGARNIFEVVGTDR